jgi:hypothetical protein
MNYLSEFEQNTPMSISFMKNLQFSRLVKADGTLREFNFRKHRDQNGGILFSVDVSDPRNNRIAFKMRQTDTAWKIEQAPLPDWVITNEHVLHELIEEELKNAS